MQPDLICQPGSPHLDDERWREAASSQQPRVSSEAWNYVGMCTKSKLSAQQQEAAKSTQSTQNHQHEIFCLWSL